MDQLEERIGKGDMCYSNLGSENKIIKDITRHVESLNEQKNKQDMITQWPVCRYRG